MRRAWIALNLVVGPLVLISYVASAAFWDAETVAGLWGAVPEAARPVYTANMFLAAAGYFAFGVYFLRYVPDDARFFGRFGFGAVLLAYALVLVGSTLWMPLTCVAIERADPSLVILVFVDLWVVAAGSLFVLAAAVSAAPRSAPRARWLAIAGGTFFCLQTVVLDGIIWPLNFAV